MASPGCPSGLVHSLVRHQLAPAMSLEAADATVRLESRATGIFTGSRVAAALGRVPVENVWGPSADLERVGGSSCRGSGPVCIAAYLDNVFSAVASLHAAFQTQDDFASTLARTWGLMIKPSRAALDDAWRDCAVWVFGSLQADRCALAVVSASSACVGHVFG